MEVIIFLLPVFYERITKEILVQETKHKVGQILTNFIFLVQGSLVLVYIALAEIEESVQNAPALP